MKKIILIFLLLAFVSCGVYILSVERKTKNADDSDYFCVDSGAGDAAQCYSKADYDYKEKALQKSDPELCLKMKERETSSAFNQFIECVDNVALKRKDFNVCVKYYTDPYNIKRCIYNVEVEVKDLMKCDEIKDPYYKTACQNYVKTFILKTQHQISFNIVSCFVNYGSDCTYSIDGGKFRYKLNEINKTKCIYDLDNGNSGKYHDLIATLTQDAHKSDFNVNVDVFLENNDYDTFLSCVKKYSE